MGTELSIDMALMSIIGGQGTVFGPLVGALFLAPLAEISRTLLGGHFAGLHLALYGLVLIIAVLYLPKGLLHLFIAAGNRIASRLRRAPVASETSIKAAATLPVYATEGHAK
jgi:branched-chain amino acid transport system permease protein